MRHTNKRAGRKRLIGRERYDNGRTMPEDNGPSPAMVRDIIHGAMRAAMDPLLRTEIGRMRLEKFIDDNECSAGMKFAEAAAAYDRMKGIPPRFARSPDYIGGYGKSLREEPDQRSIDAALSRYDGALRALGPAANAVIDIVVYDQLPVGELDRRMVKSGLARLAVYFGLTTAKK